MTSTRASLLTLVQCRPMWFWHLWGAVICLTVLIFPLVSPGARKGVVFSVLVVPFWTGVISASLLKDFFTKPFTFCAPLHASAWRRTMFVIGLVVAGVCSMVVLFSWAGTPAVVAVTVWLAFILCLALFMAASLLTTSMTNIGFLPAAMTWLLLVVLNDNLAGHIRVSAEGVLLASPTATAVTCFLVLLAAWRKLGSRNFARRTCGEAFLGPHGVFNTTGRVAYNNQRKARRLTRSPGAIRKSLERFLLARTRALAGRPAVNSIWGTLYVQVGKSAPLTAANFFVLFAFLLAVTLVLGYYHPHRFAPGVSGANLIFFLVCVINAEYRINPYASLLLNVSRKNRFRSLVISAVIQWFVVAVFAAALAGMSIAVGRFLGGFTVYGRDYFFTPIQPKAFFAFAPMMPFYFLSQVLFPRRHFIALIVIAATGPIVFFPVSQRILETSVLWLLLLQVMSWLPFVGWVRHYCYSRDLTLNGL